MKDGTQSTHRRIPGSPATARGFVQYLLGFGVSVAVGLAPYLGKVDVPLFEPLLKLIPRSVHNTLIPLSAALMGLVAVVIQWWGGWHLTRTWLKTAFRRVLVSTIIVFLILCIVHTFVVVRVPILGDKDSVSFLVGFKRPHRPPCTAEVSDAECIKHLTFNTAAMESFWGDKQIRLAKLALTLSYLMFTSCFGMLVGLVLLRNKLLTIEAAQAPSDPPRKRR